MDEGRELNKLRMLYNAVKSLDDEADDIPRTDKYGFPIDEFMEDLKEAAWNVLHENPGSEFGDWQSELISQYPTEVVDALGTDPEDVYAQLADWWESMEYDDEATGICERFRDWAEYFATERSVELYDMLVEAKREINRLQSREIAKTIKP